MKIARSIGILYRLRNVYPESVLITIYMQYFKFNTSSFPVMSFTVGVCCQKNLFSASAPKEISQNNYQ